MSYQIEYIQEAIMSVIMALNLKYLVFRKRIQQLEEEFHAQCHWILLSEK